MLDAEPPAVPIQGLSGRAIDAVKPAGAAVVKG